MPKYLTDADAKILQELIEERRRERTQLQLPEDVPTRASDVLLAKAPDGGIPALSLTGTAGTAGGEDVAGSAVCDIYRLNRATGNLEAYEKQKTVYNASSTIESGPYVPIGRTKSGAYVVLGGAGVGLCTDSGTGTDTCCTLVGVDVDSLPVVNAGDAAYVLGVDANGCLVKIEIAADCADGGTGQ